MHAVWTKFEAWLSQNWPEGLASLNPPATDEEIAGLQAALGVTLPEDYVACLKVHNGQDPDIGGLFEGTEFLSTDEILAQWTVWKEVLDGGKLAGAQSEPDSGIRNDWWNAAWIPFTHNGGGDHLCLDLAPDTSGTPGQVITMWHDSGTRVLVAPGFGAWFESYTDRVLAGDIVYSEDYCGLVDREDAEAA